MFTRRKLQITMALTLLFAMLMSSTAASAQVTTLKGTVRISDAAGSALGSSDSLVFDLTGVPVLTGAQYEGWLVASNGTKTSVGTFNGPEIDATWNSPTNENLAAKNVQLLLTKESIPDPDTATAGEVVYSATMSTGVLGPFLSLLTASSVTTTVDGVAVALHGQASIAADHGVLLKASSTLADMQTHAQHVINVIDGGAPGDAVGILAYAAEAKAQAEAAKANDPENLVSDTTTNRADAVITAADRVIDRAGLAKSNAQSLIGAVSTGLQTEVWASNVNSHADQTVTGAADLYDAAQTLQTFVLTSGAVATPPSAGDELVPFIALLALVAGLIFTGGGLAVLRRRHTA
jgi:hypothetical protein